MSLFIHRFRQQGSAALALTMILLFATSVGVLYLNRSLIFEQKSSANQVRSTTALEVAEAGMEWAIGMLNTANDINTSCALQTSAVNNSFRRTYVLRDWAIGNQDVKAATNVFPGCTISGTSLTCSCPAVPAATTTAAAALSTTSASPRFTVALNFVPRDPTTAACLADVTQNTCAKDVEAVRVTVTGCTETTAGCTPGTTAGGAGPDAVAVVTGIIKLAPVLPAYPNNPLTCGGNCSVGGNFNVYNTDPSTNGVTVNAGGTITAALSDIVTMPGIPPGNSLVGSDSSLSTAGGCTNSGLFKKFFGSTIAQYADSPMVKTIPGCTQANTCGSLVDAAYADGWRSFYFPDGFARNNSSGGLGSAIDPVTLVTAGSFDLNGNVPIYGLIFSNNANANAIGSGTSDIIGAMVSCNNFNSNGSGKVEYNRDVLSRVRRSTAEAMRVNGSWTDACRLSNANPPVLTCTQ